MENTNPIKAKMELLDEKKVMEIGKDFEKLYEILTKELNKLNGKYNKEFPLEFSFSTTTFLKVLIEGMTPCGVELCITMAYELLQHKSKTIDSSEEAKEEISKLKEKKPSYVG